MFFSLPAIVATAIALVACFAHFFYYFDHGAFRVLVYLCSSSVSEMHVEWGRVDGERRMRESDSLCQNEYRTNEMNTSDDTMEKKRITKTTAMRLYRMRSRDQGNAS